MKSCINDKLNNQQNGKCIRIYRALCQMGDIQKSYVNRITQARKLSVL